MEIQYNLLKSVGVIFLNNASHKWLSLLNLHLSWPLPLIHNALVTLVADTSERHSVPLVLENIVLRLSIMGLVYRQ